MNFGSLVGLSGGIKYDYEDAGNKAAFVSRVLMKRLLCLILVVHILSP